MRFFEAENLLSEADDVAAVGIEDSGSEVVAIVDGVNPSQRVSRRNNMIQPGGAEIFPNDLQRTAEHLCDAVKIRGACGSDRPQVEQRLHAGHRRRT